MQIATHKDYGTVEERIILGIDPGMANTGWGVISQCGSRLSCLAYGCVTTSSKTAPEQRALKITQQISAVIDRFGVTHAAAESVWFGDNVSSAFATGQARGAALVGCAQHDVSVQDFTPNQIKLAVVGVGHAEKAQVQYMVKQILGLDAIPEPDHAADALAAAICLTTHRDFGGEAGGFEAAVAKALAAEEAREAEEAGKR